MIYWLYDGITTNTYQLDTTCMSVSLPAMNRNFTATDTFTDGAVITGTGSASAGLITVSRTFKKGAYANAWNALMYAFKTWIGQPKENPLYFYMSDGASLTLRAQVYPIAKSVEKYTSVAFSGEVSFSFQMVKGYLESIYDHVNLPTVTGTTMNVVQLQNLGELRTSPYFLIFPTSNFSLWQCQLSTQYGFRIAYSFLNGNYYSFDCATGIFTDTGTIVTGALSGGSTFTLPPGTSNLQIWAQNNSEFLIRYKERYF